jgi:CheY-like chemotaxis protein
MSETNPNPARPSGEFTQLIKEILENLHDFGYLQKHSLSNALEGLSDSRKEASWEQIRRELLLAIEALSPGPNPSISSPRARSYHILNLHYLEEIPLQQCSQELGISLRQTNRELRRAEQSIAAIIWAKFGKQFKQPQPNPTTNTYQDEMELVRLNYEPVNMGLLVQEAGQEVVPLAMEYQVHFHLELPDHPIVILTDKMISRQIFIAMFSRLIQSKQIGELHISFYREDEIQGLNIRFHPSVGDAWFPQMDPFIQSLLNRMEWKLELLKGSTDICHIVFESIKPPTLLVIDDNEGMGVLLERYLSGHRCRLVTAHNGMEGLTLASQIDPDAILLDVMMPGMDGWQVLNRLKNQEITRNIPVVVCSVFNDPRLASSLGAELFLTKPLNREDFLTAIQQLGL